MLLKNMFLCDAATLHQDNTFSVLRGGIFAVTFPSAPKGETTQPPPLKLALVSTIELEVTETGKEHELEVTLMDMDGRRIIPEIRNRFTTPPSNRPSYHNILIDLFLQIKTAGSYSFYVNVDGHELGTVAFTVSFTPENK
jgi:hypothetical protein